MSSVCSIEGCGREVNAKGYCATHYARWVKDGDPGTGEVRFWGRGRKCKVDGCDKPHFAWGYCSVHGKRWKRFSDPLRENVKAANGEALAFIERAMRWNKPDCLFWPYARDKFGYAKLGGQVSRGHRLLCIKVHGEPPTPKHVAAHNCGNGHLGCVNPLHLQWKTQAQNCHDTSIHDMSARGEWQGTTKLADIEVRRIRNWIATGKLTQQEIADLFGVAQKTISDIVQGKTWAWLE